MKKLLLVNDDGINAPGMRALVDTLGEDYDIRIVAPAVQQSAMSQAITIDKKIKVELIEYCPDLFAYKVHGTPTDCVKLALTELYADDLPDIIIAGINDGGNLGTDVIYSGTVGAAMEGYFHGIFSIALSVLRRRDLSFYDIALKFRELLPQLLDSKEKLYNINFPRHFVDRPDFYRYTKQGVCHYINEYRKETDWVTA